MTQADFEDFDAANPAVWALFVKFTFDAIRAGSTRFSFDSVTERIWWFTTVETRGGEFKFNNNLRAYYARKWQKEFSELPTFLKPEERPVIWWRCGDDYAD